ncbi:MAG: hypothetical protein ACJ760_05830 [Thermoleophilaceae bacterium]
MHVRGAIGAVAVIAVALLAPAAAEGAISSLALFSDSGDFLGGGAQQLFTNRDSKFAIGGTPHQVEIDVQGGAYGTDYHLKFAAPFNRRLRRGVYDFAEGYSPFHAERPHMEIFGGGHGCNEASGRFEVRDVAAARSGAIRRLWLVFEYHCEGAYPAAFGEVRIREGHRAAVPALVRWPVGDHGRLGTAVPITLSASRALHPRSARLTGSGRRAFAIRLDDCRGKTVAAGGSCQVWVRFRGQAGTHRAKLRVPVGRRSYGAALQAFDWGGRTRVVLHSDKGDYIGNGGDYLYTPRNARIAAGGSRQHVNFYVTAANDYFWSANFSPADGDIFTSGKTYTGAARDAFRGSSPGLEVDGPGTGCNTVKGHFTVADARYDAHGAMQHFGVRFVQHCEGAKPALRGEFDWRAGDHTKSPPWMSGH